MNSEDNDDLPHGVMRSLPPLSAATTVSVIIPARAAPERLTMALDAVLAQQPPVHELVVATADHVSEAAARECAGRDGRVRVVDNPQGGTSAGLNAAMAEACGQVLVRVDTHAIIPDGYVATALATLRRTGAANVGGSQVPEADGGFAEAVAIAMRSTLGSGGATYRKGTSAGPADTVYLGVYRREALEAVGGFDEAFVRNQDAELNERLRAHGHIVWFDPALRVSYRPRDTVRALARQYFDYGRWRRATVRRHHTLRPRQLAAPALVLGLVVLGVVGAVIGSPWPLVAGLLVHGGTLLVTAQVLARRPLVGLRTALALATMHLSWGLGFLVGPPRRRTPPEPSSTPPSHA